MLTSTKRRLAVGAVVLGIAAIGLGGYRFSETGDLLAAAGLGYKSYTCADVLNSSNKSAEVGEALDREYASILGNDPKMRQAVEYASEIFGSVDGACRSAKRDDNAWEVVQPYLDELRAAQAYSDELRAVQ